MTRHLGVLAFAVLSTTAFQACASAPALTAEELAIPVQKSDPPAACKEIDTLSETGVMMVGCDQLCQKKKLRRRAHEMGANYLRLDTYTPGTRDTLSETTATAFQCPASVRIPAQTR